PGPPERSNLVMVKPGALAASANIEPKSIAHHDFHLGAAHRTLESVGHSARAAGFRIAIDRHVTLVTMSRCGSGQVVHGHLDTARVDSTQPLHLPVVQPQLAAAAASVHFQLV